ncbi:hypothetical protein E1301_Tti014261 [Triplophysa tibetana]|uniref:Uncharacterized protein n=1 Tax=Triplophysa tibetana TaxID=1572043 RepID=A0A5A9PLE3_9TELE|nr:hypothetical protein E1301_Tti014261 [Triplophysa tibetana]
MSNRDWIEFSLTRKFKELISHFKSKYYVINSESETITRLLEKINDTVKQNDNQHYIIDNYVKFIPKIKQEEEKVQGMQTDLRLPLTPPVTSPVTRQQESQLKPKPRDRILPLTPPVTSTVHEKHENKAFNVIHQPQTTHQDRRLPLAPPVSSTVHENHENKAFGVIHQPQTRAQGVLRLYLTLMSLYSCSIILLSIQVSDNQDLISQFRGKYHEINSYSDTTEITTLVEKLDEVVSQNDDQHYSNEKYAIFPGIGNQEQREKVLVAKKNIRNGTAEKKATSNIILGNDLVKEEIPSDVSHHTAEHHTFEMCQELFRNYVEEEEKEKKRERDKLRRKEEQRSREKAQRIREEELKNREEELRTIEDEQREKEEIENLKLINAEKRMTELVRTMSMRRRAKVLAALMAARHAKQFTFESDEKYQNL